MIATRLVTPRSCGDPRLPRDPELAQRRERHALLAEIEREGFQVLRQRTSLTPLRKLWLAWKTWVAA